MSVALPLALLLSSLLPALITFFLPEKARAWRNGLSLGGAALMLTLVVYTLQAVAMGAQFELRYSLVPGLDLWLRTDALSLLFLTLSAALWLLTTIYAINYFGHKPNQSRFFAFFGLCVAATSGIALSGSLITFFIFYELLTLSTWPLVTHKQDDRSIAAGRSYLTFALPGSTVLLVAIVWLESAVGPVSFGAPAELQTLSDSSLRWIFLLFMLGLGVKAALVPLHGWLPAAMAAPAPVSALLHAVAVVKAGAFGIVRVIYDVFGIERVAELGVGLGLAVVASATIVWGSLRALQQTDIKRRLAFSTVSQVSYIVLGAALIGPFAVIGGLVHLVHQGLMKITLFFCAGIYDERADVREVAGLNGLGPRMPWTSLAFSIAAMGMIGLPPMAGFVSKWYLGIGGLQSGQPWVVAVLIASTLLNAAYFLPLLYRLWFLPADAAQGTRPIAESFGLVLPPVATAAVVLAAGLMAGLAFSPLGWATLIVERLYLP